VSEDPGVTWRADVLRARRLLDGAQPEEISVLDLPSESGRCPFCGKPQPHKQRGSCLYCTGVAVAVPRKKPIDLQPALLKKPGFEW
jgi:hypothetical protein